LKSNNSLNYITHQFQYSGPEEICKEDELRKVRILFNHPIKVLIVKYNRIPGATFNVDGHEIELKCLFNIGLYYVYDTGYLNFSSIDKASMYGNINDIYGINMQPLQMFDGMGGLKFSK